MRLLAREVQKLPCGTNARQRNGTVCPGVNSRSERPGSADDGMKRTHFVVRPRQKRGQQSEFVYDPQGGRMDRVPTEVAQKIGMLFPHQYIDTGPRQQQAEHHARRAAGPPRRRRQRYSMGAELTDTALDALCPESIFMKIKYLLLSGLDVFATEPLPMDSRLRMYPRVTPLPHTGSATFETRHAMAVLARTSLLQALTAARPAAVFDTANYQPNRPQALIQRPS